MARENDDLRAGTLLGLAVGDALGGPYEFCGPGEAPRGPLEMVGGGWLSLRPGETTDDTALTRAVLEGYAEGEFDLRRVREAMLRWLATDPKDVGNQTREALEYLRQNPEAQFPPEKPTAQGNGAVMRAAAHGVMARGASEAARNAWTEAALTHPSQVARASGGLVAALVASLVAGQRPEEALNASLALVIGLGAGDEGELRELFGPLDDYRHDPGGWTVYTINLALLALLEAPDFRTGVESVVRLGGDADTNGAVSGALLGARFGAGSIPESWSRELERADELTRPLAYGL